MELSKEGSASLSKVCGTTRRKTGQLTLKAISLCTQIRLDYIYEVGRHCFMS